MLEQILKKLGTSSIQEYFDNEARLLEKVKGIEADWETGLSKLSYEELEFLEEYYIRNKEDIEG